MRKLKSFRKSIEKEKGIYLEPSNYIYFNSVMLLVFSCVLVKRVIVSALSM